MGKFFKRLPANYRAAIEAAIKTTDGGERPDIAEAYAKEVLVGSLHNVA